MPILPCLVLLIGLIPLSCVATGTQEVEKGRAWLESARKSVHTLREIPYQKPNFGEPIEFVFDEEATVLHEGKRKHFVKGFTLPERSGNYSVSITSYREGTLNDPAIMYPEVSFLDMEYQLVRKLPHSSFVFRSFRSGEGLNSVFFVKGGAESEKYLLIMDRSLEESELIPSQANITTATPVMVPVGAGFAMWMIPTGSNTLPVKMKASPTGKVKFEIQKYLLKRVGE